eukprot:scaffold6348_cov259-Pinguiococcus_pyrenoidosus.AAC.4
MHRPSDNGTRCRFGTLCWGMLPMNSAHEAQRNPTQPNPSYRPCACSLGTPELAQQSVAGPSHQR